MGISRLISREKDVTESKSAPNVPRELTPWNATPLEKRYKARADWKRRSKLKCVREIIFLRIISRNVTTNSARQTLTHPTHWRGQ